MKQLRILTGLHVGATAPLAPGVHRIASDDDADIRITDWTGTAALLDINNNGVVVVRRLHTVGVGDGPGSAVHIELTGKSSPEREHDAATAADETSDTTPVFMLDFLPMQFDKIVICVGPDDMEWPSDLALLSTLLKSPGTENRETSTRHLRRGVYVGIACGAIAVLVLIGVLSRLPRASATMLPKDVTALENLNHEFASAHLNDLHASLDGHGGVIVRGLVTNEADNLSARRLLGAVGSPRVQPRYGVAEVIRRSIVESLPIDGISVRYEGSGVFSIAGKDVDMDALQQGVRRVRHDLPADVKEIRVDATGIEEPNAPAGASYVAIVSSDTVRYAQTPDGVKHIFVIDSENSADDDISVPSAQAESGDALTASATAAPIPSAPGSDPAPSANSLAMGGPAKASHAFDQSPAALRLSPTTTSRR